MSNKEEFFNKLEAVRAKRQKSNTIIGFLLSVFLLLILILMFWFSVSVINEIQKSGIKNVLIQIWEGSK